MDCGQDLSFEEPVIQKKRAVFELLENERFALAGARKLGYTLKAHGI